MLVSRRQRSRRRLKLWLAANDAIIVKCAALVAVQFGAKRPHTHTLAHTDEQWLLSSLRLMLCRRHDDDGDDDDICVSTNFRVRRAHTASVPRALAQNSHSALAVAWRRDLHNRSRVCASTLLCRVIVNGMRRRTPSKQRDASITCENMSAAHTHMLPLHCRDVAGCW